MAETEVRSEIRNAINYEKGKETVWWSHDLEWHFGKTWWRNRAIFFCKKQFTRTAYWLVVQFKIIDHTTSLLKHHGLNWSALRNQKCNQPCEHEKGERKRMKMTRRKRNHLAWWMSLRKNMMAKQSLRAMINQNQSQAQSIMAICVFYFTLEKGSWLMNDWWLDTSRKACWLP